MNSRAVALQDFRALTVLAHPEKSTLTVPQREGLAFLGRAPLKRKGLRSLAPSLVRLAFQAARSGSGDRVDVSCPSAQLSDRSLVAVEFFEHGAPLRRRPLLHALLEVTSRRRSGQVRTLVGVRLEASRHRYPGLTGCAPHAETLPSRDISSGRWAAFDENITARASGCPCVRSGVVSGGEAMPHNRDP